MNPNDPVTHLKETSAAGPVFLCILPKGHTGECFAMANAGFHPTDCGLRVIATAQGRALVEQLPPQSEREVVMIATLRHIAGLADTADLYEGGSDVGARYLRAASKRAMEALVAIGDAETLDAARRAEIRDAEMEEGIGGTADDDREEQMRRY